MFFFVIALIGRIKKNNMTTKRTLKSLLDYIYRALSTPFIEAYSSFITNSCISACKINSFHWKHRSELSPQAIEQFKEREFRTKKHIK